VNLSHGTDTGSSPIWALPAARFGDRAVSVLVSRPAQADRPAATTAGITSDVLRPATSRTRSDHGKGDFRQPFGGRASPDRAGQVLYEDEGVALDEGSFLKATYLELKADNVEEIRQEIVAFGVKVLEVQDPHLYFQAPGGQVFRLVGTSEDLSKYEGTDHRELPSVFG
jgi:hypothetical protein